jgi:hypothetical protein
MNTIRTGCQQCRRKTTFNVKCKCEKTLCFGCRFPEDHTCTFDYKKENAEVLKKQNALVVSSKTEKI